MTTLCYGTCEYVLLRLERRQQMHMNRSEFIRGFISASSIFLPMFQPPAFPRHIFAPQDCAYRCSLPPPRTRGPPRTVGRSVRPSAYSRSTCARDFATWSMGSEGGERAVRPPPSAGSPQGRSRRPAAPRLPLKNIVKYATFLFSGVANDDSGGIIIQASECISPP